MGTQKLVNVALDKDLVGRLLHGLYNGAKAKALKVVISTDGEYYVESKELKMVIVTCQDGKEMECIRIHNEKQSALVSKQQMSEMGYGHLGNQVVGELREKYSTVFHSLADNIVVFGRAYGGN